MFNRDALIAENASHLIDFVKAAYYQSLEIKFQSDTEIKVLIKRMVMGDEGGC
jgi:hypothetical protein